LSLVVSALSTEYVSVPVTAAGDVDVTTLDVEMAFLPVGTPPEEDDWIEAEWETVDAQNRVRALVGPSSDAVLTAGTYVVWVNFDDNPEDPVKQAGFLVIV
jgi:hypothetical protein